MFTTLAELQVQDLAGFLAVFATGGAGLRQRHGAKRADVFAYPEDPNRAFVIIDWPDAAAFAAFRADPDVPSMMKSGGLMAPPEFRIVSRIAQLPA